MMSNKSPSQKGRNSNNNGSDEVKTFANRHIPHFLDLSSSSTNSLQVIEDGSTLTAAALSHGQYDPTIPILVTDTPQSIGMTVPPNLTIRDVAETIGNSYPVSVIDVQHQEELEGWTLGDLVEYFEDEERLVLVRQQQIGTTNRSRRKRVQRTSLTPPKVLNQISLEFRHTPLAALVKSPQFVRSLDWIDAAWPDEAGKPQTQYYCLTSTAGCYTDFHVDFGGTSVWYHVLTGEKHFLLISPTTENLKIYEDWLCRPNQSELFLPDLYPNSDDIQKVVLQQSQTLFIPSGWIHAVYTPQDSLVIGGNFLHGLDIGKQIDVNSLEVRTKVPQKFRFPKYLALLMYTGVWYLNKLRNGDVCKRECQELPCLLNALVMWSRVASDPHMVKAMDEIKKSNNVSSVETVLQDIRKELNRIDRDGIVPNSTFKKPKLRLKLASEKSTTSSSFRIKLSMSSKFSTLPPDVKNRRRSREDLDGMTSKNEGDDEWKPSSGNSYNADKSKLTIPFTSTTKKRPSCAKIQSTTRTVKKKTSSSRQRLMKRLR